MVSSNFLPPIMRKIYDLYVQVFQPLAKNRKLLSLFEDVLSDSSRRKNWFLYIRTVSCYIFLKMLWFCFISKLGIITWLARLGKSRFLIVNFTLLDGLCRRICITSRKPRRKETTLYSSGLEKWNFLGRRGLLKRWNGVLPKIFVYLNTIAWTRGRFGWRLHPLDRKC